MLNRVSHLGACTVTATTGRIGRVKDVLFDDRSWAIRSLVVDTGGWLPGRRVLVAPTAVTQPLRAAKDIAVSLNRRQLLGGATHARAATGAEAELCSGNLVRRCGIRTSDGGFGRVADFVFDDVSWLLHSVVVLEPRQGLRASRRVLIGTRWIDRIDFSGRLVHVALTRAEVRGGPAYDETAPVHRDYEVRLAGSYGRTGHWD